MNAMIPWLTYPGLTIWRWILHGIRPARSVGPNLAMQTRVSLSFNTINLQLLREQDF
jgi:hypothetical protein